MGQARYGARKSVLGMGFCASAYFLCTDKSVAYIFFLRIAIYFIANGATPTSSGAPKDCKLKVLASAAPMPVAWAVSAARPVRVVWGTEDRLLPWPSAAARYRTDWLPHADWVVLDDVGHCPQLDVPLETAQLILGFTKP